MTSDKEKVQAVKTDYRKRWTYKSNMPEIFYSNWYVKLQNNNINTINTRYNEHIGAFKYTM